MDITPTTSWMRLYIAAVPELEVCSTLARAVWLALVFVSTFLVPVAVTTRSMTGRLRGDLTAASFRRMGLMQN